MSWMSDKPTTQIELADALKKNSLIYTPEVYQVFKSIDRKYFWAPNNINPYSVDPDNLTNGQKLTSPVMQGIALEIVWASMENLFITKTKDPIMIADIGFGYGCTTAMLSLLSQLLKERFKSNREVYITGYEIYSDFLDIAKDSISKIPEVEAENINLVHKDIQAEKVNEKYDIVCIHHSYIFLIKEYLLFWIEMKLK